MHTKKCITIHVLFGNIIRPRFRYLKIQILWSFQGASPLDLYQDSTIELLPIHPKVLRNDWGSLHFVPTTWHASQTKRQKKYDWGGGGGAINRTASPAASLSPRHWRHQSDCLPAASLSPRHWRHQSDCLPSSFTLTTPLAPSIGLPPSSFTLTTPLAPSIGLPPQQLHSHHATASSYRNWQPYVISHITTAYLLRNMYGHHSWELNK